MAERTSKQAVEGDRVEKILKMMGKLNGYEQGQVIWFAKMKVGCQQVGLRQDFHPSNDDWERTPSTVKFLISLLSDQLNVNNHSDRRMGGV